MEPTLPLEEKPMDDPAAEPKRKRENVFRKQLVLLDSIREAQEGCAHVLFTLNKEVIMCEDCGAVWFK
jgi:hypothetical protein